MPRKKKEKEFTEAEEALLTDEEKKAINEEVPPEEVPPEEKPPEEKPPEEKPPEEPPEEKPPEEKPPEEKPPEEPIEGEKVTIVVDGEKIEGAIAKGGQYIIPYSEVQKRDERYGRVKTENETLKAQIEALKAAKPPEPKPEEKPPELDLDALEAKLYETEDVKGFLKGIIEEVQKSPPAEKPQEEPVIKAETPQEIASRVEKSLEIKQGVKDIIKVYPVLDSDHKDHDPNKEFIFTQLGFKLLGEKVKDMTEEEQVAWTGNVENLLAVTKEAAEQTVGLFSGNTGDFDPEKEREKIRTEEQEKSLEWVKTKLNLKEEDVKTLGDVTSQTSDATQKAELDGMGTEDLEEAMKNMSPEERRKYVDEQT